MPRPNDVIFGAINRSGSRYDLSTLRAAQQELVISLSFRIVKLDAKSRDLGHSCFRFVDCVGTGCCHLLLLRFFSPASPTNSTAVSDGVRDTLIDDVHSLFL